MATMTPAEQRAKEPESRTGVPASEQPIFGVPQTPQVAVVDAEQPVAQQKPEERRPVGNNQRIPPAVLVIAVIAGVALFTIGVRRTEMTHRLQRGIEKAEEIQVPLMLPLAIVGIAREVGIQRFVKRRATEEAHR